MPYPAQMDLPDEYLAALGSFWAAPDRDPLTRNLISARLLQDRHCLGLLSDYRNSFSRQKCPLLQEQEAVLVKISESNRSTVDSLYRFGDANLYFDGRINYGQVNQEVFSFSLPDGMVAIAMILDRLDGSNVTWTGGLDYTVTGGKVIFRENPFERRNIAVHEIVDASGNVTDREIWVWLWGCRYDLSYLYRFYGYAVGMPTRSTPNAKRAVNSVFDGITKTSTRDNAVRLVAAIADTGFALRDGEVVEYTFTDADGVVVVTDLQAARSGVQSSALVQPGDVLKKNQPLFSTARLDSFHRGQSTEAMQLLSLQQEWLDFPLTRPLIVNNDRVAMEATKNTTTGFLELRFKLAEHDDEFWDEVRRREVAQGISLAKVILGRGPDDDEPVAADLPATVKPLDWVIYYLLRNAILITIRTEERGKQALPLSLLSRLRYVSAPHIWYIVQIICNVDAPTWTPEIATGSVVEVVSGSSAWVPAFPVVTIENTGVPCQ